MLVPDNVDKHVTFDNIVLPLTFNVLKNVDALLKLGIVGTLYKLLKFKLVNPEPEPLIPPVTFNEPLIVVLFDNLVNPETFNDDINVDALLKLGIVGTLYKLL
jgi:hypothetical protein